MKHVLKLILIFTSLCGFAQNNCGVEFMEDFNGTNKGPSDSRFGGAFTPRGPMRMLIICAGFTNDANTTQDPQ